MRNPFDDPDLGKPATPGFIPTIKRTGGQMLTTAATSAEDVTGPNAVTKAVRETGQGIIDRNPAGITKLSDVVEKPWLAVKEAVGQFAPQIGAAAAGSFAGARVGGALGSLAGPAGTVAGAAIGGVAGGLLPIFTQEYGGIRQEQIESGQEDKGRALAAAIPATALERVGMGKALKVFKGVPGGASSIAKEVGKGALKEGATEGAQNVIEQWGAFKDPTTGENLQDTALATVMGGIGGGVMGGASGAFDLSRQRAQKPADPQAGPDAGTASDPAAPSAPPGMGFNPDAGTYTVFPDGSVALNSDLSPEDQQAAFDKRYAPPTNPTATPGAQGWTTEPGAAGQAAEQPASVLAGDGIPHENTRIVPELDAQPGVAQAALPGGIDMRGQAREFDTGSLDPQPPVPVKPSEAMGLDPAAGPMSAAAVVAVDSGLHQTTKDAAEAEQKRLEEPATQAQAATENVAPLTQATQAGDANVGQSPEVSTVAPVAAGRGRDNAAPGMGSVLDSGNQPIGAVAAAADPAGRAPEPVLPGAGTDASAVADETPAQRDWRNQLTAELATGMAYGKKLNPLQIKMRQGQLARATGAQEAPSSNPATVETLGTPPVTTPLPVQQQEAVNVQDPAPRTQLEPQPQTTTAQAAAAVATPAAEPAPGVSTAGRAGVEAAGVARIDDAGPTNKPVQPIAATPATTQKEEIREHKANKAQPQQARQPEAPAGAVAGTATEVAPRPANWRGNFMQAAKVARDLKIDAKGKKLAALVAEIDAHDAAEQQSPKHPEGASMRDAQGQWQPAVRQGMEGRVAQPIDGAPTFAEAGAAARWSQLEQAKGQSGADEEALRRLQNRVPGRVDAVAPVASTAPAAASAAQPGRELSRDIGKYKEGLSEHRANQVRSELARKTPGVIYTVEEDAALRNGYAVVGRALAPGQKLGMEKLRAAKGRAPDTSKVKDQAETTAAPAQPATKTVAPPAAKRKPRGVLAKKSEAEEKARADHFAPGNIVNSYGGQDRVIGYQPSAEGKAWSVTVQAVIKQGNEWVNDPSDDRVRQHSTEPEPGELKAGPVQRAQTATKSIAVRVQPESAAGQKDAESDAGNDDIRFSRAPSDQTKTEAFKKWFGDSKVVDAEDKPLVVYHGAPDVRGIFAEGFKGRSRGSVFFAASDYVVADSYAKDHRAFDYQNAEPQTIPLYLSINNPMIVDANGAHWKNTESYVQKAKDEGHDGIIIRNSVDFYDNPKGKDKATTVYAWFEPSQAKSAVDGQLKSRVDGKPIANATGNNGNFDPENPDIRFSFAGENAAMALTDAASVRNAVAAKFPELASSIDRMIDRGEQAQKGGLVVIESADARDIAEVYSSKTGRSMEVALRQIQGDNPDVQNSDSGDIQGFYDPKSGLQFIVAPNVSAKTAPAVVLHEAVHGQQRADLDAKAQKMLNSRDSKVQLQKTRDFLERVAQRIEDSGETSNVKEVIPYIVEQAALEGRQAGFSKADSRFLGWVDATLGKGVGNLIRDLVAAVRANALRRGFNLTPSIDDLVTLAKMAVHTAADGTVVTSKPRVAARPAAPALSRAGTGDQTQTEAFKKWFGDSKVVDAKGKPLVVYHGTGADFSIFSDGKIGSTWGADRIGHFFTSSTEEASVYANSAGPTMQRASGQIILPTYLAIQRPVTLEALQEFTGIDGLNENYDSPIELYDNMRDEIEAMLLGNEDNNWTIDKDSKASKNNIHDGVLLTLGGKTLAVAIESTQIKSAIGNNGDFNGENDDIRFSRSKTPKAPQAGTRTDRAVMDMVREGRTAQDILRLVAGTSKSRFNKQVARLLLKTGANPTVSLERGTLGGDGNFTFLARYNRKNDALGLTEGAQAQAEHIFMHEMMHAATLRALDRKGLASLQMRHLYAHVKKQGGANGQYGMKNVGEFVAEVFTNPDFQREIKGMRAPSGSTLKTAWDSFVRIMRSILGLNQDSTDALSRALELGVAVMRENMSIRTKASGADAYIADPNVVSEIQLVLDGARAQGHAPQKAVFGRAADWLVKSASVRGVDVEDFRHVLDGSAVRHMMKNHYDLKGEKSRGQIPLTDADLLALPSVVQNPDRVVLGTKNRLGREQIAYVKQLPDGSTLYLEEVRTGRKELAAVSARKYPATMNVESIVSTLHPNARGDGGNGVIVLRSPAEGNIQESGVDDAHFGSAELNNIKTKALDQIHQTLSHPGKVNGVAARMEGAIESSMGDMTPAQEAAYKNVAGVQKVPTVKERAAAMKANLGLRMKQALVDQFAPIRDVSRHAYMMARMSKASDGAMDALMLYGKPFLRDGVLDVNINDGGFAKMLAGLRGEHDRFFMWVAAQRGERLKAEDKENLMGDADISALKTLNTGKMADGTVRLLPYAKALRELNDFNEAALKVALESGLIDQDAYDLMKDQPYVPFYRLMSEEGGMTGPKFSSGLLNQKAWKKLKGGTQQLNADLVQNSLQNWSHLYAASARNRAALATMDAAEGMGVAYKVQAETKGSVKVMRAGMTEHWMVEDPYLLEAVSALNYTASPLMKPLAKMKQLLTWGVTVNPTFKIRNLIRDSISAISQSELGYNPLANVGQGWKLTASDSQVYASMLASGGVIKFGTQENTDRLRAQVAKLGGVVLDEGGLKKFTGQLQSLYDVYAEFGDRTENVNRTALYDQLIKKGHSHAEASFLARDLMDFSMGGSHPAVRFLTQTVPFLNARLQGLYKLGRAAHADPRKFAAVAGAVSLASLVLLAAHGDDEDWKKREDWDRDAYWWFKVGDTAFRIPRPFEVGAIGTLAERTAELMFEKEMTNKRFMERLSFMLGQTFAFDPVPQALKPLLDIYSNKDSFTKRAIESQADQRLRPQDRYNERTSEVARLLGSWGLPDPAQLIKGEYAGLSPKQIDHLLRGYFSWAGATAATVSDFALRPVMGRGDRPDMRLRDVFIAGNFVESLPTGSSRYVSQLYEQSRSVEQAYASYREAIKLGDMPKAEQIKADNMEKIRGHAAFANATQQLSKINAQAKRIEASRGLSGAEKRARLEALEQQRDAVARRTSRLSSA